MRNEGDFVSRGNPLCPWPGRYTAADGQASENQVGAFLAGLTALLQPDFVIETGTYHGHTSRSIAEQLQRNGTGHLYTFETNPTNAAIAQTNTADLTTITIKPTPFTWEPRTPIDLAFLDSSYESRLTEIDTLHKQNLMRPGGIIVIHDTHFRPDLADAARARWGEALQPWTPRGLTVLQAPYQPSRA